MLKWTAKDSTKASQRGWDLFLSEGEVVQLQLQKCDDLSQFETDADVWEFVVSQAEKSNDSLSTKALTVLSEQTDDAEYRDIMKFTH